MEATNLYAGYSAIDDGPENLAPLPPANACGECAGEGIITCPVCDGRDLEGEACPHCYNRGHQWCAACGGKGITSPLDHSGTTPAIQDRDELTLP